MKRRLVAAATLLVLPSSWAWAASPPDTAPPSPGQMVDALHTTFGDHHSRAVHAKGILVEGVFEPAAGAASLSGAELFRTAHVPVLARFSDFTGIPEIPDNAPEANPRGLALKFQLPGDAGMDVVAHSFDGFPAATAGEFRELLLAIAASGPAVAKPTPLDRFLAAHPAAKAFLTTQKPLADSYATLAYFGVNAFAYTDPKGRRLYVRYRFVPVGGESFLSREAAASAGPNYLVDELPRRLAGGPVSFRWYAQIAAADDAVADPSVAWPANRRLVELGVIRLDRMAADPAALDRSTMFDPLRVPPGIAAADPMLGVRHGAYPISFAHRQ
jgi:catalase